MEKGAICASADLVDDVGLKIAVDGARDVFALTYILSDQVFFVLPLSSLPVSEKKVLKP